MESAKAEAVAGEGKAVTSERSRSERLVARQEALKRQLAKPAVVERRGEAPSLLDAVLSTEHARGEHRPEHIGPVEGTGGIETSQYPVEKKATATP